MAFVDRKRPHFSETEAMQIAQNLYRVSSELKQLPSERDQNFHISDGFGKEYILKIASVLELEATLEMQNKAMEHVASHSEIALTQRICRNSQNNEMAAVLDSSGQPHFVRMLTYLPGIPFALFRPHSNSLLRKLGTSLGMLSSALSGFDHPASRRDLRWDFDRVEWVLTHFGRYVGEGSRSECITYFLNLWRKEVLHALHSLRKSVVYHDANEYNILVQQESLQRDPEVRFIDFGDMLYTYTLSEVAIGAAYAMLEKPDPLSAAAEVVRGYHAVFPLTETEISLLFQFIAMRLCLSVSICAFQQQEEPDNQYLKISEVPAWDVLNRLKLVHSRFATYVFREACGLDAHPNSKDLTQWLKENASDVLPVSNAPSVGGYGEIRFHDPDAFRLARNDGGESRSIHLGVDYFAEPGTPVYSPYEGVIHSFKNNEGEGDYGPTILVEHRAGDVPFYVLYGHLSSDSLLGLQPGKKVARGSSIGRIGTFEENGNWEPHVHQQFILDLFDQQGTFPGLCAPAEMGTWFSVCPKPNGQNQKDETSSHEVLQRRQRFISKALSIAYKIPLHIVRGRGPYLFNELGQPYLDCVNNVCHVGHSHPRVVEAARKQMADLNTNTRYLHENLVAYAERLLAKLPAPLEVCFFVCSGSEANDLALRLARNYTGNKNTIVLDGAYHGNLSSLIEISPYKFDGPGGHGMPSHVRKVLMPDVYRGAYRSADAGVLYAEDVRAKLETFDSGPPTFIVESALGCGGQIILPENYLKNAFESVRASGGVCIVDEVQVGFGRVGSHFWCFETQGVVPDIVTMGKPIGNGHPLAAVVTTRKIASAFENGMEYFNTFGGNPVSCAVGIAVLDVMEDEHLQQNAQDVGRHLRLQLELLKSDHRWIGDVRGLGLFLGIEFVQNPVTLTPAAIQASYIVERMKERGILLSTDGPYHNVIKIKPPIVFTKQDADKLVSNLAVVLRETFLTR